MRLDKYLSEHGFSSRTKAARAVAEGRIFVNGRAGKPSDEVTDGDSIEIREKPLSFVSEGGYKLRKALDDFARDVCGCTCVDLGASTGGFTDCLLQAGAAVVYAVDVGKGQLDEAVRGDSRVRVLDETNVRYLRREDIGAERIDVVTADLSFISLKLIFPVIAGLLEEGGAAYVLVKPQFECGGIGLNKHGIVKDRKKRLDIVNELAVAAARCGLIPRNVTPAPIRENKNIEYMMLLQKAATGAEGIADFEKRVSELD